MTVDNVLSFDVVTAEGKVVTASAEHHPDLFWALRGGGGNFGIVVSFTFRLHPVSRVLGGMILFPRERAAELLRWYRGFIEAAPEELTAYVGLLCAPDGTPVVGVIVCYCGDLAEGERVLQPLRAFGTPLLDAIQPMPFPHMQTLLDGAFPDGNHNYWKGMFLRELNDAAIDTMVEHASQATSPLSAVVIEYYAGAASRVPESETAFAHRNETYDIGILAQWTDPAESAQHLNWTRGLAAALEPFGSGAYLLNFLAADDDNRIHAAFGQSYARLVDVKNRYDPSNFFSVNQNIKPTI
jgi:hypothetical protein